MTPPRAVARKVVRQMETRRRKTHLRAMPDDDALGTRSRVGHRTWNRSLASVVQEPPARRVRVHPWTPSRASSRTSPRPKTAACRWTMSTRPRCSRERRARGRPRRRVDRRPEDRAPAALGDALRGRREGRQYVRERRYLYVSPAVVFNAIDKASGQRIDAQLTSVALTNHLPRWSRAAGGVGDRRRHAPRARTGRRASPWA